MRILFTQLQKSKFAGKFYRKISFTIQRTKKFHINIGCAEKSLIILVHLLSCNKNSWKRLPFEYFILSAYRLPISKPISLFLPYQQNFFFNSTLCNCILKKFPKLKLILTQRKTFYILRMKIKEIIFEYQQLILIVVDKYLPVLNCFFFFNFRV